MDWENGGESLGRRGLVSLEGSGLIEIGYHFVTATWGQGVAIEMGTRVLDYGFRELAEDPIVAVTRPENTGSQNVPRKFGLRSDGLRFHYGLNLNFFSLDRDSYLTFR
ncbi:MAG: GNAT family N-acetyltransferase [Alphaproteobacteria bacterium]|nr:GNAT family N-acetyltransferase [Alphaproteobacteria bacterium]